MAWTRREPPSTSRFPVHRKTKRGAALPVAAPSPSVSTPWAAFGSLPAPPLPVPSSSRSLSFPLVPSLAAAHRACGGLKRWLREFVELCSISFCQTSVCSPPKNPHVIFTFPSSRAIKRGNELLCWKFHGNLKITLPKCKTMFYSSGQPVETACSKITKEPSDFA